MPLALSPGFAPGLFVEDDDGVGITDEALFEGVVFQIRSEELLLVLARNKFVVVQSLVPLIEIFDGRMSAVFRPS
jgi:hypothetical protein